MNAAIKKEYRQILEDVCSEYCDPNRYCILKEFLVSSHPSQRLLFQIKCVDKYKYEISKAENKDIGWSMAMMRWVDEGYAKKYAEVYNEDLTFSALYKLVRSEKKE